MSALTVAAIAIGFPQRASARPNTDDVPAATSKPNVIIILADDLGYGDLGCYGATNLKTPHLDRLAREGLRCTDGHSSSATCTPSRFSLLTGRFAWRYRGTQILPGDAPLIIDPRSLTLPNMLRRAGYVSACVGKWHLGLGVGSLNWNGEIKPGPLELGFDQAFIMPATGDRTPCVYVEDHHVANLDPQDPISVRYGRPLANEPAGRDHPESLKMKLTHGHGDSIINGISRIGYMTGGQAARWKDEEIADTFARRAVRFIDERVAAQTAAKANAPAGKAVDVAPFFLYLPTHNVHVPRVPGPRFAGHSGCGVRGDVIEEFDDTVGQVLSALDRLGVADNTLVIVSSDNGPVLDDGYDDGAERDLKGHRPGGPWRGGKTSKYEGGTRVPLLVRWPARVNPGGSSALVCQVDLLASLAALVGVDLGDTPLDSRNLLPTLLGESAIGRETLVEQGAGPGALAFRKGPWKLVPLEKVRPEPRRGSQNPAAELYNLEEDPGETHDLSGARPELVAQLLQGLREAIQPLATLPAAADSPE